MSYTNQEKPADKTEFIATEALDFLMTESGDYLITNQSSVWSRIVKTISSWTNITK
jgi:hypothetical protein